MSIIIILCFAIAVFCNNILFQMVDRYRIKNNGIEVHTSERAEAQLYRGLIIIVAAISIFCSDFWWSPIVGYILGFIMSLIISNENSEAYIIFFGKILKPIALIAALICTFV